MKFHLKIVGESPFSEPEGEQNINMTSGHDFQRVSLQYGVPICIDFEKMEIVVDLKKDVE